MHEWCWKPDFLSIITAACSLTNSRDQHHGAVSSDPFWSRDTRRHCGKIKGLLSYAWWAAAQFRQERLWKYIMIFQEYAWGGKMLLIGMHCILHPFCSCRRPSPDRSSTGLSSYRPCSTNWCIRCRMTESSSPTPWLRPSKWTASLVAFSRSTVRSMRRVDLHR